jgi:hypothetical protein
MQFAALWDGDITVHFSLHNDDLTLHITTNIRILANCQNAVRGCNVTFEISIEDELVCKLD